MDSKANSVEGIRSLRKSDRWDAVDILWCDKDSVDGYLAADYYGEVMADGWYYEPLVLVEDNKCKIYEVFEHWDIPCGPYVTSEQALCAAVRDVLCWSNCSLGPQELLCRLMGTASM